MNLKRAKDADESARLRARVRKEKVGDKRGIRGKSTNWVDTTTTNAQSFYRVTTP